MIGGNFIYIGFWLLYFDCCRIHTFIYFAENRDTLVLPMLWNNLLLTLCARLVSKYALPNLIWEPLFRDNIFPFFKLVEQLLRGAAWISPSLPLLPGWTILRSWVFFSIFYRVQAPERGLNCFEYFPLLSAPAAATVSNSLNQLAQSARVTRYNGHLFFHYLHDFRGPYLSFRVPVFKFTQRM